MHSLHGNIFGNKVESNLIIQSQHHRWLVRYPHTRSLTWFFSLSSDGTEMNIIFVSASMFVPPADKHTDYSSGRAGKRTDRFFSSMFARNDNTGGNAASATNRAKLREVTVITLWFLWLGDGPVSRCYGDRCYGDRCYGDRCPLLPALIEIMAAGLFPCSGNLLVWPHRHPYL